jgi:hypothetical protein
MLIVECGGCFAIVGLVLLPDRTGPISFFISLFISFFLPVDLCVYVYANTRASAALVGRVGVPPITGKVLSVPDKRFSIGFSIVIPFVWIGLVKS